MLFQRVPPFGFSLFKRNLQNRTGLKGPPFRFCFGTVRLFFDIFVSKWSPFSFLLFKHSLQNRMSVKGPSFRFFGTVRHFFSNFFEIHPVMRTSVDLIFKLK